jgi:hypothetical protein
VAPPGSAVEAKGIRLLGKSRKHLLDLRIAGFVMGFGRRPHFGRGG